MNQTMSNIISVYLLSLNQKKTRFSFKNGVSQKLFIPVGAERKEFSSSST